MNFSVKQIEQYFQKRATFGIKPGLDRMRFLLKKLGHPEKTLQIVHVAGTNGKGTTVTFMKETLKKLDYHVGLFSSPSFTGLRGYFVIDDTEITEDDLINIFAQVKEAIDILDAKGDHPTAFEIITAMAFLYFVDRTDIVLLEAGMGGREDTTNVITPMLSIITTIAIDHTQFLGNTIEQIAAHKAGIIKESRPVVIGDLSNDALHIVQSEADEKLAETYTYGKAYRLIEENNDIFFKTSNVCMPIDPRFYGSYHIHNIAVALMALIVLRKNGYKFDQELVSDTMRNFQIAGRLEKISDNPIIILDSAHNIAGVAALRKAIQHKYPDKRVKCLFAAFEDKDVKHMIEQLQASYGMIHLTSFDHVRAMQIDGFKNLPIDDVAYIDDWKAYIEKNIAQKTDETMYVITGSMHFIMQVRDFFNGK